MRIIKVIKDSFKIVTIKTILRTLLVSTIITIICYGLITLSNYIVDSINTNNEYLNNLIRVTDSETLNYCKNSKVEQFLIHGIAKANEPVSLPELNGQYSYIEKVKYKYESHIETYTVTISDGNGKSHVETRIRTVWDWERKDSETYSTNNVILLNNLFTFNNTSSRSHSISFNDYENKDISNSYKSNRYYYTNKNTRYEYYVIPLEYTTTFISDNNFNMINGFNDSSIEEVIKIKETTPIIIIFYIIIFIMVISGILFLIYWEEIFSCSKFLCD